MQGAQDELSLGLDAVGEGHMSQYFAGVESSQQGDERWQSAHRGQGEGSSHGGQRGESIPQGRRGSASHRGHGEEWSHRAIGGDFESGQGVYPPMGSTHDYPNVSSFTQLLSTGMREQQTSMPMPFPTAFYPQTGSFHTPEQMRRTLDMSDSAYPQAPTRRAEYDPRFDIAMSPVPFDWASSYSQDTGEPSVPPRQSTHQPPHPGPQNPPRRSRSMRQPDQPVPQEPPRLSTRGRPLPGPPPCGTEPRHGRHHRH